MLRGHAQSVGWENGGILATRPPAKKRPTAVELVGLGVLFRELVGGVRNGVLLTAQLAVLRGDYAMDGVEEEGRGGGQQDVARALISTVVSIHM